MYSRIGYLLSAKNDTYEQRERDEPVLRMFEQVEQAQPTPEQVSAAGLCTEAARAIVRAVPVCAHRTAVLRCLMDAQEHAVHAANPNNIPHERKDTKS